MLKYVLLAATACIASPAFAQDAPPTPATAATQQTPPAADQSAPPPAESKTAAPTPDPQPATAAAQPTPADAAAPAQPATAQVDPATPAQPATAAAAPAPAQPATSQTQVAQVVSQEFGTYDKDTSGALDKAEFSNWLVALRKASEPGFSADAAASKTWLAQAFTQADTDKNANVSQAELTVFLTPKPA